MTAGIVAYGAYVPLMRLERAAIHAANAWYAPGVKQAGTRSLASWDEDVITMAVAASRDSLEVTHATPDVSAVYLASTTMPFADRLNAGVVAAAINLDDTITAADITGTRRAALTAIGQAVARCAMEGGRALVVASDLRKAGPASSAEMDIGDGAAALVIGTENILADYLGGASFTVDFVDHFRTPDMDADYAWEERWVRDEGIAKIGPRAIETALARAGLTAAEIDGFIFPTTFKGMAAQLAKASGIRAEAVVDNLASQVGDTGTGHGMLMLAGFLAEAAPGETILMLEFGSGAEAMIFRTTEAIGSFQPRRGLADWLTRKQETSDYTRLLANRGQIELEKGMRGEQDKKTALSTLYRHRKAIMALIGGKCRETGSVYYPPSRFGYDQRVNVKDMQDPYPMADRTARVLSWSAERLSAYPAPPHHYGQLDFDGGGRILMEFTDVVPGEIESGATMELVFRVKDRDALRGFVRYFWKAVRAREDG